jgi:hypothetical protein
MMEDDSCVDMVAIMMRTTPKQFKAVRELCHQKCARCGKNAWTHLRPQKIDPDGSEDVMNIEPVCPACRINVKAFPMSTLIEKLSGEGSISEKDEFIANVQYEVRIYRKVGMEHLLEGDVVRGQVDDDVVIRINPITSISALVGKRLTLHMNDGRKLDFWVASSKGDCTAFGGPY